MGKIQQVQGFYKGTTAASVGKLNSAEIRHTLQSSRTTLRASRFFQIPFAFPAGPAGGAGSCSLAEGEGGGGGQAGGSAGQEGEGDPEEGHQEGAAETQDLLQGSVPAPGALVAEFHTSNCFNSRRFVPP